MFSLESCEAGGEAFGSETLCWTVHWQFADRRGGRMTVSLKKGRCRCSLFQLKEDRVNIPTELDNIL